MKLDDTILMYGIYNAETLEKLINTVQEIHNVTTSHEKLFAGEHNPTIFRLLYMDALDIQQYAFNSLLFLRVIQDKYISLYRKLITQFQSYVSAIRVLTKGYLPTTLLSPSKLQGILAEVMKSLQHTNPTNKQPLPKHLNIPHYDNSLTDRPSKLKEFLDNYIQDTYDKESFDLQKRHTTYTFSPYKNFFLNQIVYIFTFTSSIISIITITLVIYLFCKHKHIRTILASLILHKAKEVEAKLTTKTNNPESSTLAYIGMALTIWSMTIVIFLHYRKSKFCIGYRFSNIVKIVLSISDVQNYISIKLCKTSGCLHLFKIKGMLKLEDIKLNKNYLWGTLEINWNGIKLSFNGNEINLPKIIMIKI